MKKGYIVIIVLVALAFAASAVLIPMMPDTVPAHYNAAGEVDRMGSRYESLIFPAFALFMGAFMACLARRRRDTTEETALLVVGAASTALFVILGIFFGIRALNYDPEAAQAADVNRISAVIVGVMLIVTGNFMPKVRRNGVFGLRTPWSMKNDDAWLRSQRFGGVSAVICGFLMIISALLLSGVAVMIAVLTIVVLWTAICTYMSYRYAKS